jgi:myosin heavy subunit
LKAVCSDIFLFSGKKGETIAIPMNKEAAIENRDALAKVIYTKMFDHLIIELNNSLGNTGINPRASRRHDIWIGILDIYGFENFQKNSLEQFCINYANEKLHHQYNSHLFKSEQSEYEEEGINWNTIEWMDNSSTVELFERPNHGLLGIMDEEVKIPKSNDATLMLKIFTKTSKKYKICMGSKRTKIIFIKTLC